MDRTIIDVVKNDKLYEINFTVKNYNQEAVSLAGINTLKLKAQKVGATALAVEGSMTVVDEDAGTCKYTVQANDFDEVGHYNAEIEAVYVNGQTITWRDILIKVAGDLPK